MNFAPSDNESGYIMPATALLLIPIAIFFALAIDVGGWTVHASRTQAAADAGALAGAALLPDHPAAAQAATELVTANGYVDGVDGIDVEVTFPSNTDIRVSITSPADRFFSPIVSDTTLNVTRFAEATSLSPVGTGSPTNVLGFGPYSLDGIEPGNYWMLEGNDCTPAHFGDYRAARYLEAPWCSGTEENPVWKGASDGRDGGYFYEITIPPGLTDPSTLMILDPGRCAGYGSKPADTRWNRNPAQGTYLEWRQWDTNGTPLLSNDDTPSSGWWTSDECVADLPYPAVSWTDQTQGWTTTPFVFPGNTTGEPETHLVQTNAIGDVRHGWNYHSLWVKPNNATTSCNSIGVDTCPTISAEEWIATGASGQIAGDPMFLFLAEVGPEHAGRTMNINVWDTGEGMDNIQVIDPAGDSLDFTWESDDPAQGTNNASDTCGANPCLDLIPSNTTFPPKLARPGWGNHFRFNGRLVTLSVPLDSQVDFASYPATGNGFWFRIRFEPTPGNIAREWATFSINMDGDPIRLTY